MSSPSTQFIEDCVTHPEWLRVIEAGEAAAILELAKTHGYGCTLEELKESATELLSGGRQAVRGTRPDAAVIDAAASGLSDLESDAGYGDDTGYAALYGVAGSILKLS